MSVAEAYKEGQTSGIGTMTDMGLLLDNFTEAESKKSKMSIVNQQRKLLIAFLDYSDPIYWGENEYTDRRQLIDEFLKSKQLPTNPS